MFISMATNEAITAAITSAETLAVEPSQVVALIDKAIAASLINGLPVVSLSIAGQSREIAIEAATALRRHYASLAAGGGMVAQEVEF